MAVNPFTKPAKVGEFVPTESAYPVKREAQVTGKLKQRYDKARAADSAAERTVENIETAPFSGDQKLKSQIAKRMKERIEKRAQEGDYENMMRQVREDAATTQSLIKPIRENKKAYQDYVDKVKNMEKVSRDRKRKAIQKSLLKYKSQNNGLQFESDSLEPTGGYFEGRVPSEDFNAGEKVMELVDDWQSNGREWIPYRTKEGDLVKRRLEENNPAQIRDVAMEYLQSNPEFQSYADDTYFEDFYGEEKDLSRFMEETEVTNNDGEKVDRIYGRTIHPQNKSPKEVLEEYESKLKQRDDISDEQAEELAKQMTHKQFYEYEIMSNAAKSAAMKEGYKDRQLDIIKMDDEEEDEGRGYEDEKYRLTTDAHLSNPAIDPFTFQNGEVKYKEKDTAQALGEAALAIGGATLDEIFGHDSPTTAEEVEEAIARPYNPLSYTRELVNDTFDAFDKGEAPESAKKMLQRAEASARLGVNRDIKKMKNGEELPEDSRIADIKENEDGEQEVKLEDSGKWVSKDELVRQNRYKLLKQRQNIYPEVKQSHDGKAEENAQQRLINNGQAYTRAVYMIKDDGTISDPMSFQTAFNKATEQTGVISKIDEYKNPQQVFDKGFGTFYGKVGPDNPVVPSAWGARIGTDGNYKRLYISSGDLEKARKMPKHNIHKAKFRLESYDLQIPNEGEENADEMLSYVKNKFGGDGINGGDITYGDSIKLMPISNNGEVDYVATQKN